jgi:hypothetical protein
MKHGEPIKFLFLFTTFIGFGKFKSEKKLENFGKYFFFWIKNWDFLGQAALVIE